jgi:hypothetical protein
VGGEGGEDGGGGENWVVNCFTSIGIEYSLILESYNRVLTDAEQRGADNSERFLYLKCMVFLIKEWVSTCFQHNNNSYNGVMEGQGLLPYGGGNNNNLEVQRNVNSNSLVKARANLENRMDHYYSTLETLIGVDEGEVEECLRVVKEVANVLQKL